METQKNCKYWQKGMCCLWEMEDCQSVGDGLDCVHPCDFMIVPCFNN